MLILWTEYDKGVVAVAEYMNLKGQYREMLFGPFKYEKDSD